MQAYNHIQDGAVFQQEVGADDFECCTQEAVCRLVYLKPNQFSNEAIAVGILIEDREASHLVCISSQDAFDKLTLFYGKEIKEQLIFALDALRVGVRGYKGNLDDIESPSSLINFGPSQNVLCGDSRKYARDYLEMSSSLFQYYKWSEDDSRNISQDKILDDLYNSVSRLDIFRASEIFLKKRVKLKKDSSGMDVPIFGARVMGAPISFVTHRVSDAKTRAEAYIAKFSYARSILNREAALYMLMPSKLYDVNHDLVALSRREVEEIGMAHGMKMHFEENVDLLAKAVLRDQVA